MEKDPADYKYDTTQTLFIKAGEDKPRHNKTYLRIYGHPLCAQS